MFGPRLHRPHRIARSLPCGIVLVILALGAACASARTSPRRDVVAIDLQRILRLDQPSIRGVAQRAAASHDLRYVAPLVELLRFSIAGLPSAEISNALNRLTGETHGLDWEAWYVWMGNREIPLPSHFATWKGELYGKMVDREMRRFLDSKHRTTIRPELIQWGGVRVDGIPALVRPKVVGPKVVGPNATPANAATTELSYLTPEERVFGVSLNGEARAYPLRILDWHEMANDVVGGQSVALAYCTLCGAGVLYATDHGGKTFTFGSSGLLYESNKLMYDRETDSLWNQMTGVPVSGELVGSGIVLKRLPLVVTTWGRWKTLHPETTVLSLDTGHRRDYTPGKPYGDYFASPKTMFPITRENSALAPKTEIFALALSTVDSSGGENKTHAKAYPLERLVASGVVNDQLAGRAVVLLAEPEGGAVRAFERKDREFLRFQRAALGNTFLTDQDGRAWKVTEDALVGPEGARLERLPGHLAYWFGWATFYPDTELWRAQP
jgi:Protein of unknown function (DUF3179)